MTLASDILHATKTFGRGEAAKYRRIVAANPDAYRAAIVEVVLEGWMTVDQGQEIIRIVDTIVAGGTP